MSAGTRTFRVLISYDDPSGSGRATCTLVVPSVVDKEHAKRVVRHVSSRNYANLRITRATEVRNDK